AWIKTTAIIPGSMSGGGAYSKDGKLIGIPTVEPVRASGGNVSSITNCRRIQDSNGDGHIDDRDTCIPVSGFVNALRPSRLARGLVLAAQLGIAPSVQGGTQTGGTPTDPPSFSRLFFSPGVS